MIKKYLKNYLSILICIILTSCSTVSTTSESMSQDSKDCLISTRRTGIVRQGIKGFGFDCTKDGSYFLGSDLTDGNTTWLLYSDHGSNSVIKLCGRPDCDHSGKDCNAYFKSAVGLCCYDGFFYTYDLSNDEIIRMNLDGTDRKTVYNVSLFAQENGYRGEFGPGITNGVFVTTLKKIDKGEDDIEIGEGYYYKLDGSMKELEPFMQASFIRSDGDNFVGWVDNDESAGMYTYGLWSPDKGVTAELFQDDHIHYIGYIGADAEYTIEDGIIVQKSYTEGKKELIDTGLKGDYQLVCFPDCMIVHNYISEENTEQDTLDSMTLYFYSWDGKSLGSVETDFELDSTVSSIGIICGETPDRIILSDNSHYIPKYYIDKSDFGTGNIEIHSYKLPEFDLEAE